MSINRATSWPFLRLYALALLFFSANSILNVIVPLRSESLGASNTQIGLIMGAYMLTCMFFRPWAGAVVHKYGPVKVLRILLIVNGIAIVGYTLSGLEVFFAARMLQGMSTAFFSMALQMGIMDSLQDEERSQGVSLYSLFTYIPTIIGPVIALGVWEQGGINGFTIIMVGIAITTGLFGFSVPIHSSEREEGATKRGWGIIQALQELKVHRPFLVCSITMMAASVVFGSVTAFIPLYASRLEHGHAGYYLMIQAAVLVSARYTLRKKVPSDGKWRPRLVSGIMLLAACGAALLALSDTAGAFYMYAAALFMGFAQALLYPTLLTYLSFVLPATARNVLLGLFIAMGDLGVSLGGIAMGPVADNFSYSVMYGVCAVAALIVGIIVGWTRMTVMEGLK